jgi:hypothetical protein
VPSFTEKCTGCADDFGVDFVTRPTIELIRNRLIPILQRIAQPPSKLTQVAWHKKFLPRHFPNVIHRIALRKREFSGDLRKALALGAGTWCGRMSCKG